MGSEDLLTSRALPGLLVFALAACGGRYANVGDGEGSAGTSSAPGGTDGKSPGKTQGDPDPGGPVVGQGGSSTGSGGAAQGGAAIGKGGSGIVMGGSFGTAGAALGGSGGANPGNPVSNVQLCNDYCSTLSAPCPDRGPLCSKLCIEDLTTAANTCLQEKRAAYACIARESRLASSCNGALAIASKLCGATNGVPMVCADACDVSAFGDGEGCHAITSCAAGEADLNCLETGGNPSCTCSINGSKGIPLDSKLYFSAKDACTDDGFRQLCASYLP